MQLIIPTDALVDAIMRRLQIAHPELCGARLFFYTTAEGLVITDEPPAPPPKVVPAPTASKY